MGHSVGGRFPIAFLPPWGNGTANPASGDVPPPVAPQGGERGPSPRGMAVTEGHQCRDARAGLLSFWWDNNLCNRPNKRCPRSFPAAPWANGTPGWSPPGFAMAMPARGLSEREEKRHLRVLQALGGLSPLLTTPELLFLAFCGLAGLPLGLAACRLSAGAVLCSCLGGVMLPAGFCSCPWDISLAGCAGRARQVRGRKRELPSSKRHLWRGTPGHWEGCNP